jgi:hypothetical protein
MDCLQKSICCCQQLVIHDEPEPQGPSLRLTAGYTRRNQHMHICPKVTRFINQPKDFFGIFPLEVSKDGEYRCGPVECGHRSNMASLAQTLKRVKRPNARVVYSIEDLPTDLSGPTSGKYLSYQRTFPKNGSRRKVRYWSARTRWMHSAATMLHLMASIPPEDVSEDEFVWWSSRVQSTAVSLWCLADFVLDTYEFGQTRLKWEDFYDDGIIFYGLGYGVSGESWDEFSSVCGESLLHPTYHVNPTFLEEDENAN